MDKNFTNLSLDGSFLTSPLTRARAASTPFVPIQCASPSSRPRALSQTHSPRSGSFYFTRSDNVAHSIPAAPSPIAAELIRQIASIEETLSIVAGEEEDHDNLRNHIEALQSVNQRFFELQPVLPSAVKAAEERHSRLRMPVHTGSHEDNMRQRRESTSSVSTSSIEEENRAAAAPDETEDLIFSMDPPPGLKY